MKKFLRRVLTGFILFCVVLVAALSGPGCAHQGLAHHAAEAKATVVLISIDGYRWDYPEKTATPNLDFLMKTGVRAKRLIPCFPSKTFPNHYSIVTGLYPEQHGIVANNMYDPELNQPFSMGNRAAVQDGRWWGGEPIWVTAEKQGLKTAPFFWPGSEAEIEGVRPTYWMPYDGTISNQDRVRQILAWLDLPADERPAFITGYFSTVDQAGHRGGPDSDAVVTAIQQVDAVLGMLLEGLRQRGLLDTINLIVVSDHGMAAISPDQVIFLDDYIDPANVDVIDWSPVLALNPKPGTEVAVYEKLVHANPHLKVYRKAQVPERLRYRHNRRIPAIIGIADEGWSVTTHAKFEARPYYFSGGNHGFDNQLASMGGIFVARGPAFKSGLVVEPFENIQIYNLMAAILHLKPAPNEGHLSAVRNMLTLK